MESKALVPVDERTVDFYGDELTAVLVQEDEQDIVYVPLRPICDFLGLSWPAQTRRIRRDPVLSDVARGVAIMATPGGRQEMTCLPLEYLNGWLFGVSASRVKEELRDRLIRYQRECYRILASAFVDRSHTAVSPAAATLLQVRDMGLAIVRMAEEQLVLTERVETAENRLQKAAVFMGDIGRRVSILEKRIAPGEPITDEQAAEVAQQVKALAITLTGQDKAERGRSQNHYQGIFGELHRRFGVTSYKLIPQGKYAAVLEFLDNWLAAIQQADDD
jgi:hypothetical protein